MFFRIASSMLAIVLGAGIATAQTPADSRLKRIAETKTVKIAYRTDATPFSFVKDNEPVGYTIDLCKLVVAAIEKRAGVSGLKIEWVLVTGQTRFETIASGKADLECGSSTVTLGRMEQVDFSNYTFVETTGVVAKAALGAQGFKDLAGKRIAVISGTTNERAVADQLKRLGMAATIVAVNNREAGMSALDGDAVDAFASDKLLLVGARSLNPQALRLLPDDLSFEPYGIALPRGDWALRLAVNAGLADIYRSGRINDVFKRWFDQVGLQPGVLLSSAFTLGALAD